MGKAFDYGICISRDDVPKDYEGLNIDENDVEEARFEELQEGEPLTKDELEEFQERWVENASSGQHDADNIPAFALVKVQDPEGKISVALLYRYGYSFSEMSTSFSALFSYTRLNQKKCLIYLPQNQYQKVTQTK